MKGHQTTAAKYICEAKENGLLFSPDVFPSVFVGENQFTKVYSIKGSNFEVDNHFEILCSVGYGAYGIVCAAVDLRLVTDSSFYNERGIRIEKEGKYITKKVNQDTSVVYYELQNYLAGSTLATAGPVPTLRCDGFSRKTLLSGNISPFVAIKKVPKILDDLVDGRRILRELKVLRYLSGHPNIIRVLNVSYPPSVNGNFRDIYITTELMDTDLYSLLKSQTINEDQFRYISYQMIKSLVYVHSSGVIHRDMKPSNVLLNRDCDAKLCDFGLARGGVPLDRRLTSQESEKQEFEQFRFNACVYETEQNSNTEEDLFYTLTDYVVTRYYRPPELLIMGKYNHAVDMWSVGCIMAEMLLRRPIFRGTNYLSQLTLVLETPGLRGFPQSRKDVDVMFEGGHECKHFIKEIIFPQNAPAKDFQKESLVQLRSALFGSATVLPDFMPLLGKLLSFDPRKRITALEALRDPFFRSLYSKTDEIVRHPDCREQDCGRVLTSAEVESMMETHDVEWAPKKFVWEFDHRITDAKNLQELFRTEIETYSKPKGAKTA